MTETEKLARQLESYRYEDEDAEGTIIDVFDINGIAKYVIANYIPRSEVEGLKDVLGPHSLCSDAVMWARMNARIDKLLKGE